MARPSGTGSRADASSQQAVSTEGFDPARMSTSELRDALAKLRRKARLLSEMNLADLNVARYEPPSEAVDRQLDRNLMASSRISRAQKLVRDELAKRGEVA